MHLVLLVIIVGCESPQQSGPRQHWTIRQDSLGDSPEPKTSAPDPQSEEILQQLEAPEEEIRSLRDEDDMIQEAILAANAAELEELRRKNEELQQALFAIEGQAVPIANVEEAVQTPVPTTEEYFVKIMAVLPNPVGNERSNEAVELLNLGASPVSLKGWILRDRTRNVWELDSLRMIAEGATSIIVRDGMNMGLNNDGDHLWLVAPDGRTIDEFTYDETVEGVWIRKQIK